MLIHGRLCEVYRHLNRNSFILKAKQSFQFLIGYSKGMCQSVAIRLILVFPVHLIEDLYVTTRELG